MRTGLRCSARGVASVVGLAWLCLLGCKSGQEARTPVHREAVIAAHDSTYAITHTIAPGQAADLVLLDGDPLAAIRNTRRIFAVVLNGHWLGAAAFAAAPR